MKVAVPVVSSYSARPRQRRTRSLPSFATGAAVALFGALLFIAGEGCNSKSGGGGAPITCKPGSAVYCLCQDRDHGEKVCNDDGRSYGTCDPCETSENPGIPDEPGQPPVEVDAGADAQQPTCGDKIVQEGEDCDDGNKVNDDGCDDKCHLAGANPFPTRTCPGLDVHVWGAPVAYSGTTVGSPNTGTVKPACAVGTPTAGASGPDRIFKVTAHKTGKMTVTTTETDYDSFLYAAKTCATDGMTVLACANKATGTGGETIAFAVTAGQIYSVVVDGAGISNQQGRFKVTFAIP